MDKQKISLKDKNGELKEYEVMLTITSDDGLHNYIFYTDNTKDIDGDLKIYVSSYKEDGDNMDIYPVETQEEWNWIKEKFYERKEN